MDDWLELRLTKPYKGIVVASQNGGFISYLDISNYPKNNAGEIQTLYRYSLKGKDWTRQSLRSLPKLALYSLSDRGTCQIDIAPVHHFSLPQVI